MHSGGVSYFNTRSPKNSSVYSPPFPFQGASALSQTAPAVQALLGGRQTPPGEKRGDPQGSGKGRGESVYVSRENRTLQFFEETVSELR